MLAWRSARVAALWVAGGCGANWHREELSPERQLPARQQVQLWMGDQTRVLHGVIVDSESVSGIPFHRPPDCDSCRVIIARSTVDSMRLGNQERGLLGSMAIGYVALGVAALVLYFSVDTD
jgi:hypothetical protein